jgi:hypothetical protein
MNIDKRIKALLRREKRMAEEHKKTRVEMKRLAKLVRALHKGKYKKSVGTISDAKLKKLVAEITKGTKELVKTSRRAKG